jgi:GT2 family glycosyltransferase
MLTEQAVAPRLISGKCPSIEIYDADIIILTLNRCIDTIEAVQSAANQKLIRTHITVLDQGSNFEAIEAFTTAFDSYENIAFFASDRNLGVAGADSEGSRPPIPR